MCRSCRIPHRQHLALGGEINILHGNVGIVLRHLLPQHSHDFVCIGCLTLQCATEQLLVIFRVAFADPWQWNVGIRVRTKDGTAQSQEGPL